MTGGFAIAAIHTAPCGGCGLPVRCLSVAWHMECFWRRYSVLDGPGADERGVAYFIAPRVGR